MHARTPMSLRRYRAALVLDGNTVADRLSFILASMTAVIKQESSRREAFYSLMKPHVHYIPVKRNLQNLEAQLRWAFADEARLHRIAKAGATLALKHLSRRAQLCHWTSVLVRYAPYVAQPVTRDPDAVRRGGAGETSSWPTVFDHIRGSPLRPQLSHSPARLEDFLSSALRFHTTPCVGLSNRHVCVDL